jgi:hypothetical protein
MVSTVARDSGSIEWQFEQTLYSEGPIGHSAAECAAGWVAQEMG